MIVLIVFVDVCWLCMCSCVYMRRVQGSALCEAICKKDGHLERSKAPLVGKSLGTFNCCCEF